MQRSGTITFTVQTEDTTVLETIPVSYHTQHLLSDGVCVYVVLFKIWKFLFLTVSISLRYIFY